MEVAELHGRVMASDLQVLVVDGPRSAARDAVGRLRALEARWSRFEPTSDISRLNAAAGSPVEVHPSTIDLVDTMVEAWHLSGGRFDPTLLPSLVDNGYRASVEDARKVTDLPEAARSGGDPSDIAIDRWRSTISLPPTMALDPGGIGKGLAADRVAEGLLADGAAGALVSIGGDLAAAGAGPLDGGWQVAIEDPHHPDEVTTTLRVVEAGVATSSVASRTWMLEGSPRHHLIDPATGAQATTDLVAVTVVAPTAWLAEALATAALLTGSAGAIDFLTAHDVEGTTCTASGAASCTRLLRGRPTAEAGRR